MKHLDLFSGIGGFALACKWAGIETIGFVEIDSFCQKVLNKNFPNIPIVGDIRDVKEDTFPKPVDIITGGFPCQPFSLAGQRRGEADDRYLWPAMCNVIKEYKPTWVLGENVAGIISMAFYQVLSDLEDIGYEAQALVIPACAINAPHKRDRVWFIAHSKSHTLDVNVSGQDSQDVKQKCNANQLRRCNLFEDAGTFNINRREILESSICREDDGISNRVDRLKSLGNAIVPQVAYQILRGIKEYDRI